MSLHGRYIWVKPSTDRHYQALYLHINHIFVLWWTNLFSKLICDLFQRWLWSRQFWYQKILILRISMRLYNNYTIISTSKIDLLRKFIWRLAPDEIIGSRTKRRTGLDSSELAFHSTLLSMLVINDGRSDTGRPNEFKFIGPQFTEDDNLTMAKKIKPRIFMKFKQYFDHMKSNSIIKYRILYL